MKAYNPSPLEGSLKLSLGKDNGVGYLQDSDGTEILVPLKGGKVDFEVGNAWWHLGAKYDEKNF
ncbi:hypothetical protein M7I_6389 [Glarea lozoyensis 74030]|nr:hypothetical protein M7I_6389 [Glarea lozoyensis 74030]